jgi:hypothetical protein
VDVWHIAGKKRIAEYEIFGTRFLVFAFFGPGTPVGQFDRFEVVDASTGERFDDGGPLYDAPCQEAVRDLVVRHRVARAMS